MECASLRDVSNVRGSGQGISWWDCRFELRAPARGPKERRGGSSRRPPPCLPGHYPPFFSPATKGAFKDVKMAGRGGHSQIKFRVSRACALETPAPKSKH